MRHSIVMLVLLVSAGAQAAGKDDAAILKANEDFAAAWNKHDYKAMTAFFADDGEVTNPIGRTAKGKADVEKLYQEEQTTVFKDSHFTSDCKEGIRMLKPDVAVVTCTFEATGGKMPDGKALPPMKGRYTAVMAKVKGKWVVEVGQAMVPMMPPGPPPAHK